MGQASEQVAGQREKLSTVRAIHGDRTLRLLAARERLAEVPAVGDDNRRLGLSMLMSKLDRIPRPRVLPTTELNNDVSADIAEAELEAQVQKVLAIMAVMINESQAEIASMNEILEAIHAMDGVFFAPPGSFEPFTTEGESAPSNNAEKGV